MDFDSIKNVITKIFACHPNQFMLASQVASIIESDYADIWHRYKSEYGNNRDNNELFFSFSEFIADAMRGFYINEEIENFHEEQIYPNGFNCFDSLLDKATIWCYKFELVDLRRLFLISLSKTLKNNSNEENDFFLSFINNLSDNFVSVFESKNKQFIVYNESFCMNYYINFEKSFFFSITRNIYHPLKLTISEDLLKELKLLNWKDIIISKHNQRNNILKPTFDSLTEQYTFKSEIEKRFESIISNRVRISVV